MTTAAMLNIKGNTYIYEESENNRLRRSENMYCTRQLARWLQDRPQLRQIALAGEDPGEAFLDVLIHRVDLVLIPESWLQHLPARACSRRARHAIQLASKHRREPILCKYAPHPDDHIPF